MSRSTDASRPIRQQPDKYSSLRQRTKGQPPIDAGAFLRKGAHLPEHRSSGRQAHVRVQTDRPSPRRDVSGDKIAGGTRAPDTNAGVSYATPTNGERPMAQSPRDPGAASVKDGHAVGFTPDSRTLGLFRRLNGGKV